MFTVEEAQISQSEIIADYQIKMALESEDYVLDKETVNNGVKAVFNDISKGKYYICNYNDRIIASLLTTFEWSDWRNGTVLWIQSVYVDIDFRKQGVFRAMYKFLKEKVERDSKLMGLRLYVDKTNYPAISVYKNIGMTNEHYHFFEWMKG